MFIVSRPIRCENNFFQSPGPVYDEESFEQWKSSTNEKCPTFHFWDITLRLEVLILIFIRSLYERNFLLMLKHLKPLFHTNYARWPLVHIRDMKSLSPAVKEDVQKHWVVAKAKPFSMIPIDQAHEQNNAIVKGSGGAVGLTESPTAYQRWMVSSPSIKKQASLLACWERFKLSTSLKMTPMLPSR